MKKPKKNAGEFFSRLAPDTAHVVDRNLELFNAGFILPPDHPDYDMQEADFSFLDHER